MNPALHQHQQPQVNQKLEFLFDPESRTVINSQMLEYKVRWHDRGQTVAVCPKATPEITYIVDISDANSQSCTCDTFMYKADPQKVGYHRVNTDPCRHITLVQMLIRTGFLSNK
jgi:hypothetical protein